MTGRSLLLGREKLVNVQRRSAGCPDTRLPFIALAFALRPLSFYARIVAIFNPVGGAGPITSNGLIASVQAS